MNKKDKLIAFLLPTKIHEKLKKEAKNEDRTVSNMLRVIVNEWLEGK